MSAESGLSKPTARDLLRRWRPIVERRASAGVAWRWFLAAISRKFLSPAFLVLQAFVVAVLVTAVAAMAAAGGDTTYARMAACVWLTGRAYHTAVLWLRRARFSTTTRVWLALPDRSHRAWFSAGRRALPGFVSLVFEAAGLGFFLGHPDSTPSDLGILADSAGLAITGSLGAAGWLLLAASVGKKFSLPQEAGGAKKVIVLIAALGCLILFAAGPREPEFQVSTLGRWLFAVPPIGWAIGHPNHPAAIVAASAIPWVFMPWIARRFRLFIDRNHCALLALQWSRPAATGRPSEPSNSEPFPAGRLAWPPSRVPMPRWAFLDRLFLAMLSPGERRTSRLLMVSHPAPLTLSWIQGTGAVLTAFIGIGAIHTRWEAPREDWAVPLGFLFFLAGLLVLGFMLSGDLIGPLMRSDGKSRASYPFFAGFPVSLRDLVFLEWKLSPVRVVSALPVILGYIAGVHSLFGAPEVAIFSAMFTLAGLIGVLVTRPTATIRRLRNATAPPNAFSATFWWFSVSGIGLVVTNALIVIVGIQFGLAEPRILPLAALALGIATFFHWIVFHSAYNRGETSLEPRLARWNG